MALPKVFQHVYSAMWLLIEVNNGGFDQYFFNQAGEFAYEAAEALKVMRLPDCAECVRDATNLYLKCNPDQRLFDHQGPWRAKCAGKDSGFEALDSRFYDASQSLRDACVLLIRDNTSLFAVE
jgi:hypothetical protein